MSHSPVSDTSSDLYGEEDLATQEVSASHADDAPSHPTPASEIMYDDSPLPVQESVPDTAALPAEPTTAKRRLESEEPEPETIKRQRVQYTAEKYFSPNVPPTAGLPAEIWQHIFLYFPPDTLSRCLRVNRAFNSYLTRLNTGMSIRLPPRRTGVKIVDSEAIWTSSRKLFAPNLPRPLSGFGEMQMFQLLGGKRCLNCDTLPTGPLNATSPWTAGPGPNGVRVIWNFYTRLCGTCFELLCLKDVQVLVSPAAPLRAGLLHAFRTNDLHYIPPTTLQVNPAGAPKGSLSKVYYRKNIDDLQEAYQDAKELGDAAAEEWVKGLPSAGKLQLADTARWERWEALHPPGSDPARILREYFRPSSAPSVDEVQARPAPHSGGSLPAPPTSMKYPLPQRPVHQDLPQSEQGTSTVIASSPLFAPGTAPPQYNTAPSSQVTPQQQWRPPRTLKEATEAKAARRADIERRCQQEFQPPLMPHVLQHMECFHAAMQITNPLTDAAWEMLKSRLMAQRDAAEQTAHIAMEQEWQRAEQMRALQASIPDNTWRDSLSKNANEAADRQWEAAQAPIRKKLGSYADSFIMAKYPDRLKESNCSKFAIEVLLYCRNKYVEENKPEIEVRYEDPATEAPDFVSLENMRWLFDEKVKPVVDRVVGDRYNKDLFNCADCPGNKKGYAFEGLMQHFGAKHTDMFTKGNIVVHWQTAEWPEEPPFVIGAADPTIPEPFKHRRNGPNASDRKASSNHDALPIPAFNGAAWSNTQHPVYPANPSAPQPPYGHDTAHAPAPQTQPSYPASYIPSPTTTGVQARQPSLANALSGQPHETQLNEVAKVAREVWDSTAGVKDLLDCVRVQTVLYHVAAAFKSRFGTTPTLDMITEALANHILMRPLKNASGVACRTCVSYNLDGEMAFASYEGRIAKTKLYNLSSLVAHFKAVHLQTEDWKADMVELPDDDDIRDLVKAIGMTDDKLATIAEAFPGVFPSPLPHIGPVSEPHHVPRGQTPRRASQNDSRKNKKQKRNGGPRNGAWEQDDAQGEQSDNLPEPAEDEYDPRRPAFVETAHKRNYSNGRKSLGDAHRPSAPSFDLSALNPATIAALANLNIPITGSPHAGPTRQRSPSIPRVGGPTATAARHALNPADPYLRETAEARNGRESGGERRRSGKRRKVAESESPEQDYTQIIRTPATGPYEQQTLSAHPGLIDVARPSAGPQYDQYGRPIENLPEPAHYPRHEAPPHAPLVTARVEYVDQWGRPCDAEGRPLPPAPPPPRPIYVDEYGREIQVIEHPAPMHEYAPVTAPPLPHHHQQRMYAQRPEYAADGHRVVYYEQPPAPHQFQPQPAYYDGRNPPGFYGSPAAPPPPSYQYDDGRGNGGRHP